MNLTSLATVLAVVCTPVLAHAEVSNAPAQPATESPSYRSENTAVLLSVGGTAASIAMLGAGLALDNSQLATAGALSSLITPSLGHWYAGDMLTAGMGLRAAGAGLAFVGLVKTTCLGNYETCHTDSTDIMIFLGLSSYAIGTVYDLTTAGRAAREHNEKFHITGIAPTAMQSTNGQVAMGMGIGGTF